MGIFSYFNWQMRVREKTGTFYHDVLTENSEKLLNDYRIKMVYLKENFALLDLQDKDIEVYLYHFPISLYFEKVEGLENGLYMIDEEETSVNLFYKEKGEKLTPIPTGTGRIQKLKYCWLFVETLETEEKKKILFTYEQGIRINLFEAIDIETKVVDDNHVYLFLKQKEETGYEVYQVFNDRYFFKVLSSPVKEPQELTENINVFPVSKGGRDFNLLAGLLSSGGFYEFGLYERIESFQGIEGIGYVAYTKGNIHLYPCAPYGYMTFRKALQWNYQEIKGYSFEIIAEWDQVVVQVKNLNERGSCFWQIYQMKFVEEEQHLQFEFVNTFQEKMKIGDAQVMPEGIIYPFVPL